MSVAKTKIFVRVINDKSIVEKAWKITIKRIPPTPGLYWPVTCRTRSS